MILQMMEKVFDKHYQEHQGIPSCSPFHKYCFECGNLNKAKLLLGPYSVYDKERYVLISYKCTKYHPIWSRHHTHFVSKPWSVQDLLNVIGKDISLNCYKRLAKGEETFITSGDL